MATRSGFGTRAGFILAATGSAVGLGNIWKFPYMAGEHGGGAFLLLYLILVATVGLSVMIAEVAIGRATAKNTVGAFQTLKGGTWTAVGFLGVTAGFVILSFYSVVGGWTIAYVLKTATGAISGGDAEMLGNLFSGFISDPMEPLVYHAIFMALTVGVVLGGIEKGIERAARILMPLLFILLLALVARSITLPGAWEGLRFFLVPDLSRITAETFNAALSQAFFSLSLGMGAMLTYGSYLSKRENLASSAAWVTGLDTLVALLGGLLVLPAVFAFGFDPAAGPGLTFITLPAVFAQMPLGGLFAPMFFLLLTIAALTSAVSLLEVVTAYLVDEKNHARKKATPFLGFIIFLLGIPSSLSLGIWSNFQIGGKGFLDAMDYLASNILLPVGGLLMTLFVGWVVYDKIQGEITREGEHHFPLEPLWRIICRFLAPLAIAWILISGL